MSPRHGAHTHQETFIYSQIWQHWSQVQTAWVMLKRCCSNETNAMAHSGLTMQGNAQWQMTLFLKHGPQEPRQGETRQLMQTHHYCTSPSFELLSNSMLRTRREEISQLQAACVILFMTWQSWTVRLAAAGTTQLAVMIPLHCPFRLSCLKTNGSGEVNELAASSDERAVSGGEPVRFLLPSCRILQSTQVEDCLRTPHAGLGPL